MIINTPTHTSLKIAALRFHFLAWEALIDISADKNYIEELYEEDEKDELTEEFFNKTHFDLESIYMYIAQCNELALRARICEVSPYLLLINTENRFKSSTEDIDFSELRTVDAVDLPNLVNGVSDEKLTEDFVRRYNLVRSLRNKIMHLGHAYSEFSLDNIIDTLVAQYKELWGAAHFFKNWVGFNESRREVILYDYKNHSSTTDIVYSIPFFDKSLRKSQFEIVFVFKKSSRRYICISCCQGACLYRHGTDLSDYKTAYLQDRTHLRCALCEESIPVTRRKCNDPDCMGDVMCSGEFWPETCCTCGGEQE